MSCAGPCAAIPMPRAKPQLGRGRDNPSADATNIGFGRLSATGERGPRRSASRPAPWGGQAEGRLRGDPAGRPASSGRRWAEDEPKRAEAEPQATRPGTRAKKILLDHYAPGDLTGGAPRLSTAFRATKVDDHVLAAIFVVADLALGTFGEKRFGNRQRLGSPPMGSLITHVRKM